MPRMQETPLRTLHVEGWSPEYGAALEAGDDEPTSQVDPTVETADWAPIPGSAAGAPREVAFVDGVRRPEARLTLASPDGLVPGLMAAFGVGAVVWDRTARRSEFCGISTERLLVMAGGHTVRIDLGDHSPTPESVAGDDPALLVAHVQERMRAAESALAAELARPDRLVVADGPIREGHHSLVGFVKTHRVMYLDGPEREVVAALRPGRRTPLFLIGTDRLPRYAWYLRLADLAGGHAWTGIARCEVSTTVGLDAAVEMAGWTAELLPELASEPHLDPRAPQNLVPIGGLERQLRRSLGDLGLMVRRLRSAVMDRTPVGVGSPA